MIVCPLGNHDKTSFSCGEDAIDEWFRKQAGQDVKRGYSSVFVAVTEERSEKVIGFYSLSAASVNLSKLPEEYVKWLPRYPEIPAVRLGRLAVHKNFQGNGMGRILLFNGLKRCCTSDIAWAFFLVDCKNQGVRTFYRKFYFESFLDNNLMMWMQRKQAEKIVALITDKK